MHARPKKNAFKYSIFNLLIPVHEDSAVRSLTNEKLISLRTTDYLEGRPGSLFENAQAFLAKEMNYSCDKIWLQTLPRILGYVFNPVSFWYCYKGETLDAVLCEVNNTFGDRHFYFVKSQNVLDGIHQATKKFHVSPFFPIEGDYTFEFKKSFTDTDTRIQLHSGMELKLDTRIRLKLRSFRDVTKSELFKKYGWMTVMVIIRIHYQALKLWLKGVPFFTRPQPPKEKISYAQQDN